MASLKELQDGLAAADAAGNTADAQAFADAIRSYQPPAPEQGPTRIENHDPAMAFSQGLAKAAIATPGMLSSGREFLGSLEPRSDADRWIAKNIIPSLSNTLKGTPVLGQLLYGPTSQELLDMVDKVVPFQENKGLNRYVERAGEAYMPGPGGKLKAGEVFSTQAARDALAATGAGVGGQGGSDLAGALDLGPTGQSIADFLGSWAGVIASKGKAANEVKIAAEGAPTKEALERTKSNAYREIKSVPIQKQPYTDALEELSDELPDAGVFPEDTTLPDKLGDLNLRPTLTMPEVLSIRQRAGREAKFNPNNPNPHTPLAARMISEKLDDYFTKAAPQDPRFSSKIKKAGELGRSVAKSEDFESVTEAGGNVSQMGEAIGKMNEARALAKRTYKSLSPLEKRGVKNIVGRNARNPLRILGRGFNSFLTQGAGAGISAGTLDPTPVVATSMLGIVGRGMEGLADRMSLKKIDDLIASIRAGRPKQERATRRATRINKDRETAKWRGLLGELRANMFNDGQEE